MKRLNTIMTQRKENETTQGFILWPEEGGLVHSYM